MGFFDKPEIISPGGDGGADRTRLLELEQRVARLEAQLTQLMQSAATSTQHDGPPGYAVPPPPQAWMAEVQALRSADKLIAAIKLYRERTGVGLKEAKDAVEALPT